MTQIRYCILMTLIIFSTCAYSQVTYPRIAGYVGIIHPITTFSKDETSINFKNYYQVGFPIGINIWKSAKVGFSLEIVPNIRVEKGIDKMNNLLIHPGIIVALGKGFVFAGRAAFETSGRYGITPVFNKTVKKNKNSGYYIAVPLPLRFGNDHPVSLTAAFQFGLSF